MRTLVVLASIAWGSLCGRGRASVVVEIGDDRAASGAVVVGSGVAVSGELAAVTVAVVAVGGLAGAAVVLLSRDAPVHGGITEDRALAASASIALGSSTVVGASVVEIGDGRAASDAAVAGGGVTVSGQFVGVVVAAAAVEVLSRDSPARG